MRKEVLRRRKNQWRTKCWDNSYRWNITKLSWSISNKFVWSTIIRTRARKIELCLAIEWIKVESENVEAGDYKIWFFRPLGFQFQQDKNFNHTDERKINSLSEETTACLFLQTSMGTELVTWELLHWGKAIEDYKLMKLRSFSIRTRIDVVPFILQEIGNFS